MAHTFCMNLTLSQVVQVVCAVCLRLSQVAHVENGAVVLAFGETRSLCAFCINSTLIFLDQIRIPRCLKKVLDGAYFLY